jgi:hypothetical protein
MGTGPPPPAVHGPGVPPIFPWEVGESGARGIAGDESGVVYLGIPNRLSFLLTFKCGTTVRLSEPGVASSLAFLAIELPALM